MSFDYFYKLDAKLKIRYLEKTAFIRKEDLYALKNDTFGRDIYVLFAST